MTTSQVRTSNALEIRNLTGGYRGTEVLHDITMEIPAGAITALLGANGAGKTTMLRMASGLLRPTSGSLIFNGQDITTLSPTRRAAAGLCLIPEGKGVFPNLSVKDNLRLQIPPGSKSASCEEALELFPVLRRRLSSRAGEMSGGEQQMLALARARLASPSLILLDEVSMGLAPRIVEQIFDALKILSEAGAALLMVEQYVSQALEMAEYAYILDRGTVSFGGSAAELDADTVMRRYLTEGHA
ncbi:ABC transporter ATP-binding protein [Nocardia aurantia]|uniref:High-affinity branched-chain amino acid transport ATP-binding protein LivF n=1 Tax=Nocardia aurantia TaxID=2585199 RepID=A0A7K0E1G5_9NOCA|nr:ABC transporter ATP-binding protein [Nocardia aurantia]MQY31845.1 High-affinity branched-chain amino acid transport ATP-binding protein LivF [Nocardia aurantia]